MSPYANTSDMADKALHLLNNPESLDTISAALVEIGAQNFSLHGYISQLEQLLEEAKRINDADQALIAAIENGDQFDLDHWNEQAKLRPPETRGKAIRSFVWEVRSGIRTREPMKGYNIHDLGLKQNKSVQELLLEFSAQPSSGQ